MIWQTDLNKTKYKIHLQCIVLPIVCILISLGNISLNLLEIDRNFCNSFDLSIIKFVTNSFLFIPSTLSVNLTEIKILMNILLQGFNVF